MLNNRNPITSEKIKGVRPSHSRRGDTVPHLIWQGWQRSDDVAESIFYDANVHLLQYPPVLPAGVPLVWPELPTQANPVVQPPTSPWD